MWGDGQPLRPTTNVALSSNAEIRGVFGALARVVLSWGTVAFPGGSIGERVLRGPARKGNTAPQRARWDAPAPATPSIPTIVLLFTLLPLPRLCPGHCRGCATSHAAAFPAQPTHTHTGEQRVGVHGGAAIGASALSVPRSAVAPYRLNLVCSSALTLTQPSAAVCARRGARPVAEMPPVGSCGEVTLAGRREGRGSAGHHS